SGTIHALGAGMLVVEVQTPSDTTFRVYDFNRIEPATGQPRALHVEQAMQCIHFDPQQGSEPVVSTTAGNKIGSSAYFALRKMKLEGGQKQAIVLTKPSIRIIL